MSYLLLLLLATGPGAGLTGGELPTPLVRTIYVSTSGTTLISVTAAKDTLISEARWTTTTGGLALSGTMTLALRDDGASVCTLSVPCTSSMASSIVQACGVLIAQGSVVEVVADRSSCIGASPEGNLSYLLAQ